MKGNEVIELIERTCDTDCELLIEIEVNKERKFFKIVRTSEVYIPKGSQYGATLVGVQLEDGEAF